MTTIPMKPRGDLERSFEWPWYEENCSWVLDWASGASRALEFGCGVGWMTSRLASAGVDTLGIDIDESKIRKARETYPAGQFRVFELRPESFESGHFDFVVSNQVIEHVSAVEEVLTMLHRVLVPGGRAFISVPNGSGLYCLLYDKLAVKLGRRSEHLQLKSLTEWTQIFGQHGFRVVRVLTQNVLPYRLFAPGKRRWAAWLIHRGNHALCAITPRSWAAAFFFCLDRIDVNSQ